MHYKKLLVLVLITMLIGTFALQATEEGENEFQHTWSSEKLDFPDGIPYTLWATKTLPDFNDNGKNEIFCAADDPVEGAWYFVVEATANDEYEVVWYYYISDCIYSYVLDASTPGADLDGDGLPELIAGVAQPEGPGAPPGVRIWEKDTTITDAYPFPMDQVTAALDINGLGGSISMIFAGNVDTDPNTELVVGETREDIVWVVEETSGDLSFPLFETEYTDTLVYSPWGFCHGDMDNDGTGDFAIGSSDYNSIRIYECTGEEDAYVKHMELNLARDVDGYCLRGMGQRDINGDGLAEIIYVRNTSPGKVFIVTNPGELALIDSTNVYTIWENLDGYSASGVAYGDMDHGFGSDGNDLYFIASSEKVIDMEYIGPVGETADPAAPGDPANWVTYEIFEDTTQSMQHLCISDFDRDGEGEVALVYRGGADENYIKIIEHETLPDAGFEIMWHDDSTSNLDVDPVHSNPRGVFAGSDIDQDGKKEIICTEYEGMLHVYEVIDDNTVEWVWSYKPGAPSSGLTPRDVKVGDVDGNGNYEIIAFMGTTDLAANPDSAGMYFFEWDGTDNGFGFDGGPTYILPANQIDDRLVACNRTEGIWIEDVDADGNQEVLWPSDASGIDGDGLYIFSCIDGNLTGFPTWLVELAQHRGSGECTGSPKMVTTADLNGNGQREAIFATWNNGQVSIFEATAPDTYEETVVFTDTTLTDETIYKGMGSIDVDQDGDDELIFNSYWNATVYLIDSPENIADIDVYNPDHYAWLRADAGGAGLTGAVGDQDQDGLPEFYVTLYTRGAVRMLEYNGGGADIMAPASWTMQEVFVDRDFVYGEYYGNGVVSAIHGSFGIMAPEDDLDGDGQEEIVVTMIESPYSDTWLYVFEHTGGMAVSEKKWRVITPNDYKLAQNFPNPFNPTTSIEYTIPLAKQVTVKVYNLMGQEVKTLLDNQYKAAGTHRIVWDGTDNSGSAVASGNYIYSLEVGNVKHTKRMTLIK